MGPEVEKFEKLLKNFFKREVCCFNSGTAALQIAIQSCGIGKGDEILVPCITYVATYQAISATGAKPVLCDINTKTLNIDLIELKKKITKKTKAIIPVHFSGHPCNLDQIYNFSKKHKIKVIEDSAHAFGSTYKKKKIGSQGYINCFSFDGIKNITSGEGGCLVTNDKKIIKKAKIFRSLGVINDANLRYKRKKKWNYNVKEQGWRYHMSDLNAAIGIAQLNRFPKLSKKRQELARYYDKKFKRFSNYVKTFDRNFDKEVPHIYCLLINKSKNRDLIRKKLLKQNIETGVHYKPGYLLDYYKFNKDSFPKCESVQKKVITLPLHPGISKKDIDRIVTVFIKILKSDN